MWGRPDLTAGEDAAVLRLFRAGLDTQAIALRLDLRGRSAEASILAMIHRARDAERERREWLAAAPAHAGGDHAPDLAG